MTQKVVRKRQSSHTAPCWRNPAEGRSLWLSSVVMGKTSHTVLMSQGTKRGFSYKCLCLLEKLMSTGTAAQHHWEENLNLLAKSGFSRTVGAVFMQICFPCSLHKFQISSTFSVVKYEIILHTQYYKRVQSRVLAEFVVLIRGSFQNKIKQQLPSDPSQ